jgi:hypothetical protein
MWNGNENDTLEHFLWIDDGHLSPQAVAGIPWYDIVLKGGNINSWKSGKILICSQSEGLSGLSESDSASFRTLPGAAKPRYPTVSEGSFYCFVPDVGLRVRYAEKRTKY